MDKLLFVALSGGQEAMQAQAKYMNNLANITTPGFRAEMESQESAPLYGDGLASRVYTKSTGSVYDFNPGNIQTTGNDLDVAVDGKGWIAVQNADGKEGYTRAGNFKITETGELKTGAGHIVLGNGGPIVIPPAEKIEFGNDGTLSLIPLGQNNQTPVTIERIKLVNPDETQLTKGTDGLFYNKTGESAESSSNVKLISGAIEGSNVNAIDAMVNIMSLSRQFELQLKIMKEVSDNSQQSAQIMQLPQ